MELNKMVEGTMEHPTELDLEIFATTAWILRGNMTLYWAKDIEPTKGASIQLILSASHFTSPSQSSGAPNTRSQGSGNAAQLNGTICSFVSKDFNKATRELAKRCNNSRESRSLETLTHFYHQIYTHLMYKHLFYSLIQFCHFER